MLNNDANFSLINAANVLSGLLSENFVKSASDFEKFDCVLHGIPILIPADPNLFEFENDDIFTISQEKILKTVYGIDDPGYVGMKHAFSRFEFLAKFSVRSEYASFVNEVVQQNRDAINYVKLLQKEDSRIGAFQTRNIPHLGHEKIIQRMLDFCDHLVINPVLGPKKKGDVTVECLSDVFRNFAEKKFGKSISFQPIFANMFYAGPREAVHHAIIRNRMGFQFFTVGRDHAGAQNVYEPDAASRLIKKVSGKLDINVMCHAGAVFCVACDEVVLVGDCSHDHAKFTDISGTAFRASIINKQLFAFADEEMQHRLFKSKIKIFET
jgi:sulfate adenylyltransferase